MKTEPHPNATSYPASPTGLAIFWLEILELAHASEDSAISQRLGTLVLAREHLDELFGRGAGTRLWNEYCRAFATFSTDGAAEIAKKIRERSYDDVDVTALSSDRGPNDPLRTNLQIYSVRLKRADETDGIRIDTFVHLDGSWRTGLKVGQ